jgi:hypothetical protein
VIILLNLLRHHEKPAPTLDAELKFIDDVDQVGKRVIVKNVIFGKNGL